MVRATWADTVDWASELYATLLVDQDRLQHLPPEEQHAHTTLQLALRGLAVLDDTSTASSIRALHDLLAVDLETSIPRVGRFGDGVYVGPISTGKGLAVDVTYVLGLSEDLYPGSPSEDVLLPDRIRAHLDGGTPQPARPDRRAAASPARRLRDRTRGGRVVPPRRPAPDQGTAPESLAPSNPARPRRRPEPPCDQVGDRVPSRNAPCRQPGRSRESC